MTARPKDVQEMFLPELLVDDSTLTPQENRKRYAEAQQRIIWPAYSLCLALVAVAVLLSGQFNRRGHWHRIAIAVVCGIVILFTAIGLRGLMATHPIMIVVAYLNLFAPAALALWVLGDRNTSQASFKEVAA